MNFLASPTVVTAMAFSGKLSFDPQTDSIETPDGQLFKFSPPQGEELPASGFTYGRLEYYPPPSPQPEPATEISISPTSQRLQLLEPFRSPFDGSSRMELPRMTVLMRVRGKCTTDHISAAGPWLKYKGHLQNISENLCRSVCGRIEASTKHQWACSDHSKHI